MKTLLYIFGVAAVINIAARSAYLATKTYPRTVTYSKWEDVISVWLEGVVLTWILIILFKG